MTTKKAKPAPAPKKPKAEKPAKPAKAAKPAKPRAARKPKAKVKAPALTLLEANFCHEIIYGKTPAEAAVALGLEASTGAAYMHRAAVNEYLREFRSYFAQLMAEGEAKKMFKRNITRETIAERYMDLASVPPQMTRDSIEGQVKALEALVALLGLKFDMSKLPGLIGAMSDEELKNYETANKTPQ